MAANRRRHLVLLTLAAHSLALTAWGLHPLHMAGGWRQAWEQTWGMD